MKAQTAEKRNLVSNDLCLFNWPSLSFFVSAEMNELAWGNNVLGTNDLITINAVVCMLLYFKVIAVSVTFTWLNKLSPFFTYLLLLFFYTHSAVVAKCLNKFLPYPFDQRPYGDMVRARSCTLAVQYIGITQLLHTQEPGYIFFCQIYFIANIPKYYIHFHTRICYFPLQQNTIK